MNVRLRAVTALAVLYFLLGWPGTPAWAQTTQAFAATQPTELIRSGPVLGCAGADFLTVACRTSEDAVVTLALDNRTFKSQPGTTHSFKVSGLKAGQDYEYSLLAQTPAHKTMRSGPFTTHTISEKKFRFAIFGDSRSNPETWAQVAQVVRKARPDFCVLVGDYVSVSDIDTWDQECFGPAHELFATTPCFCALGNHEITSPVYSQMFISPSGTANWSQRIGPLFLMGVNGRLKFEEGTDERQWVQDTMNQSDSAPFFIMVSHYPAWTSTSYGKWVAGLRDECVSRTRNFFLPLLVKHHATALVSGHAHSYERSEPGPVTCIVTAGGGAPLHGKAANADLLNPWSKAFAKEYHYTLFTIDSQQCSMKAINLDGEVLDETQWKPRVVKS